jgi:hypothetical protein
MVLVVAVRLDLLPFRLGASADLVVLMLCGLLLTAAIFLLFRAAPAPPAEEIASNPAVPEVPQAPRAPPPPVGPRVPRDQREVPVFEALAATRATVMALVEQAREACMAPRLDAARHTFHQSAGLIRQRLYAAAQECGAGEQDARRALMDQREGLSALLLGNLEHMRPPATTDVKETVDYLIEHLEAVVLEAPFELLAPEAYEHLHGGPADPLWVGLVKAVKRVWRRLQHRLGRPDAMRTVPYRRLVRRYIAGEMVLRLRGLERQVGRTGFQALQRFEQHLRAEDHLFQLAVEQAERGLARNALRDFLQDRLPELKTDSAQAVQDVDRLGERARGLLEETARGALTDLERAVDLAGTFRLPESRVRFGGLAPQIERIKAEAKAERGAWIEMQNALCDRVRLWLRSDLLRGQMRKHVLSAVLAPAQRLHDRITALLCEASAALIARRDEVAAPPAGGGEWTAGALHGLVVETLRCIERRVERPLESLVVSLTSGPVVDRILKALAESAEPLPESVSVLSEARIKDLAEGRVGRVEPATVRLRAVTRGFFNEHVAVALAEQMRALEQSAEAALEGTREARKLLSFQLGQADLLLQKADPDPDSLVRAKDVISEACSRAEAILYQHITQCAEVGQTLLAALTAAEQRTTDQLWERIHEQVGHRGVGRAVSGAKQGLEAIRGVWRARIVPRLERARAAARHLIQRATQLPAGPVVSGTGAMARALRASRMHRAKLPYIYGKLFSLEPAENEEFIVGRAEELALLREICARPSGGAVAIVGDRGSGRSSLLGAVLQSTPAARAILRLEPVGAIGSAEALVAWLAGQAGVGGVGPAQLAGELAKRELVVVLDGLEQSVERSAGGLAAMDLLADLVVRSSGRCLWLVTVESTLWAVLRETTLLPTSLSEQLLLQPLPAREVEEAVMRRHKLSGLALSFERGRVARLLLRVRPGPRREGGRYFRELRRESRGNPRVALDLWLRSVQAVAGDRLSVERCPRVALSELRDLEPRLGVALALCLAHTAVDLAMLAAATGWDEAEARTALGALEASQLVTGRLDLDGRLVWSVPAEAQGCVARELARRELLPLSEVA